MQLNNSTKKCDPRDFLEQAKSRIKQNNPHTVFLIGGGKSLLQYLPDKTILKDQNVITCNDGYLLFPDALVCHFADWCWFTWNKEKLLETCLNQNITCCINSNFETYNRLYNQQGITVFRQERREGLTNIISNLNGGNTGHQAINLAYHLGFTNIVLLGYDLLEEPKTHWHNNHKRATNTKNFAEVMIPGFNTLTNSREVYNINIVNVNKQSALKCFNFGTIEEFL